MPEGLAKSTCPRLNPLTSSVTWILIWVISGAALTSTVGGVRVKSTKSGGLASCKPVFVTIIVLVSPAVWRSPVVRVVTLLRLSCKKILVTVQVPASENCGTVKSNV